MLNSYTRGQISIELYVSIAAVLLLFLSSLVFTMQIRRSEENNQINMASVMLAQRIANSADILQRNLCREGSCSISLMLPNKLRGVSFSKEVDYSISFSSNKVIVTPDGYPSASTTAGTPLEGLRVSLTQTDGGKLLVMEGSG
ncbi:MAG: hypothetical protein NT130_01060 [Candidatus Micrarchaeota archaeon]|nr:hypothetical protein [Candidatus Micrarchaeota archaeon]